MTNVAHTEGIFNRLQRVWGQGLLHQSRLNGPTPDRFYRIPVYPRKADIEFAQSLAHGSIKFRDAVHTWDGGLKTIWEHAPQDGLLFKNLHGFSWLPGALAVCDSNADAHTSRENIIDKAQLRDALEAWLARFEKWNGAVWAPQITSERLMFWTCCGDQLLALGDSLWRSRLLNAMAHQTRHLAQTVHKVDQGLPILYASMGCVLAGLCLPACDIAIERGLEVLRREHRLQVRSDGGHFSRNPSVQLELVIRLQMIVETYEHRGMSVPGFLRIALSRMAGLVEYFRCGDGRLAVFNGSVEDDPKAMIAAGQALPKEERAPEFARFSQYQRISAGRSLLIVDVGSEDTHNNTHPYQGASSFQFSSGRSRMIVNCGPGDHLGHEWSDAMRLANAHTIFCEAIRNDRNGMALGDPLHHQRMEDLRGTLIEMIRPLRLTGPHQASRELSQTDMTANYMRRLFLAPGGDDFRGEEKLENISKQIAANWVWRFHLHPDVKASMARDGQSAILVLPNQEGWRFRTNSMAMSLEPSIYLGLGENPVQSEQIVIKPFEDEKGLDNADSGDIIIKWALRRLDGV